MSSAVMLISTVPMICRSSSALLARPVQLDEEDGLPVAERQRAIGDRDGLGRVHEQAEQMGMGVGPVIDRVEVVQPVAVARHQALQEGGHVALKLRLRIR